MQCHIKCCDCFILYAIDLLPDNQMEISLMNIQVESAVKHVFAKIEPNLLCDSISGVLLREERKHEMASITEIHKGELHFVMVVMIEYEVVNLFATTIRTCITSIYPIVKVLECMHCEWDLSCSTAGLNY